MDFEKHLDYNAYKDSLNEIFDKLDEVIYISNTIDYKKINILLSEIVQNFDYYNTVVIPSANVVKVEGKAVGGKRGRRKVKGGAVDDIPIPPYQQATPIPVATQVATPIPVATQVPTPIPVAIPVATPMPETTQETPSPPQSPLPYSNIDDQSTTIQHITEGDEYKNLVSYIQKTKTRIDDKGGKLKTKVDNFINNNLLTLDAKDNHMIRDDFLKQYSSLVFKLEDIIKNIQNINHGIQDEGNADAKINVDLMTNEWVLFSWGNTHFFTTDWLYRFIKKPFSKDAHVINADKLTKERYNTFREKLYNLYVELYKGFPQLPDGTKYETDISELVFTKIRVKLEEFYKKELKAKAEEVKAEEEKADEANEAETDVATNETADDTTVKVKSSTTQSPTTTQSPPQSPSIATQQPPQSSEEDITNKALQKIKEGNEARTKATADALDAKAKLMKIEAEAKSTKDALSKQKENLEKQARASVLAKREEASSTLKGLIGSTPQITKAKNSFDNLGKDLGNVGKQFGLLNPKIPPKLTQQFATV